ncbi:hypothetical protein NSK_007234 [Nannochloropsis salina CCMP1776]|uniref:DUF155 domain-containing protein n=1 Tax=Nannochloropsis salina CCMP1776 TaxID=1027361 RepID=A0A4D9CUV9_9STRA|nr:hypothetical protein NSK_007234 [Nannochloropsis salina CCMP1776]|eukprot:TFJ81273.1 hypothetical protein NSK_007234 [Nannochloropsis salina CCMP1776]
MLRGSKRSLGGSTTPLASMRPRPHAVDGRRPHGNTSKTSLTLTRGWRMGVSREPACLYMGWNHFWVRFTPHNRGIFASLSSQASQQSNLKQSKTGMGIARRGAPPSSPLAASKPSTGSLEVDGDVDSLTTDPPPSLPPSLPAPLPVIEPSGGRVSVMAFYVGQNLDLVSVVQANFLSQQGYKMSDDLLLVPLEDKGERKHSSQEGTVWKNVQSALVVFKHGSVVFFNVPDGEQAKYLHSLSRHCGEVVPQSHRFRETLECWVRPWQEKYHVMGQDVVQLRELNEDSIKVLADVIGHSVALNFYNKKADRMLEDFRVLNNSVEGSGVFTEMDKKDLFKLVALNNKILTDAMSSGLLEQSKPAWNFNRLDALWNDLRDEFSIGERFGKVEHKISHVQSNTKFFLEVLNHQKSNKLEWIIIVLIAAEIVLSCIDLYHQILV